jgi:hypothetical protein
VATVMGFKELIMNLFRKNPIDVSYVYLKDVKGIDISLSAG